MNRERCEPCEKVWYSSPQEPFAIHPSGTVSGPSGRIYTFDVYACPLGNGWHAKLTGRKDAE